MTSHDPESERRRPGRLRRWVLRPAIWAAAAAAVAAALLLVYLDSPAFAERARRAAERRLTSALAREVTIGGLELDLLPPAARLTELAIAGPAPDAEPSFTLAAAVVEAGPRALLGRELELGHLYLDRPRLRIGFDEEGRSDLPRAGAGNGGGSSLTLRLGTIEIDGGELLLDDDRTPIDFAARDLEAVFTAVDGGLELRGRAETEDFALRLPPGREYGGALEVHGLIRAHRFDVVRARASGPDLEARASGYWRWHGDREVALDIEAEGDLGVLGRLGYLDGRLAGPFRFTGGLTRKPGIWLVEGDVRSPRATVFDRALTDLATRLRADTNRLAIEIAGARHGGGGVTGSVTVGLAERPGRVDLDLRLDRVRLARLLGDIGIPITGVGGGVSGPFNYQFDSAEPAAGNGWGDLVIADERAPTAGDVPLTGTVPLAIGAGVVRTEAVRLTSPGFRLTGGGAFDLATGGGLYLFELDADRVEEVLRLVPGGDGGEGPAAAWRPRSGRGRASGRLELGAAGAALRLELDLADVVAPGYRADSLAGVVAVDGGGVRELRLEAKRSGAVLRVNGGVPFAEPAPPAAAFPFSLALDAAAWPLAEARAWLPFELPVDGPYTGLVELGADPERPDGLRGRIAGRVAPVTAAVGDLEGDSLAVEADFDAAALRLAAADLAIAGGVVSAAGRLGWEEGELDLAFHSTPLDLSRPPLAAALPVHLGGALGAVDRLEGRLGGRLEAPRLVARVEWAAGAGGGAGAGAVVDLDWRDGRLDAAGSLPGLAAFAGGGALAPERVDVELAVTGGRLGGLVALAAPGTPIDGEFEGRLRLTGSYDPELELETAVTLERLTARLPPPADDLEAPVLANLEPVVVVIDGDGLRLESLYLGDDGLASELFVGGRVGAGGALDLHLQTSVASDWLALAVARAWPGARWSGGNFDAIATIGGELDNPRINGIGEVRGARLVADGLPTAIEDLGGTVLFSRDQVVVDAVTARLAGGAVRAGGVVPLAGGEGFSYRFQASGERLSYRSPDGWTARGDAEVVLASAPDGRQLGGVIALDQVVYVKDVKVGLEQLLGALFGSQRLEVAPAEGWRATTQLNVRIEGERALRMRNNLADLRGSADLVLRGTLARPVVFGTIELEPGGRLDYAGADYEVERGQLSFTNPYRIEPVIDLAARTELREYDITLILAGTPDRLALDFTSDPPLADLDVLALLTGAPGEPARGGAGVLRVGGESVAAESFLYGEATSLIARRFNRLFGLDKFRIDPLTGATGELSSARVTVGERLSRDLSVTYSYDPTATEEQVLEIDWNVSRSMVLVLTQNGDGTYAVDARWEKAF